MGRHSLSKHWAKHDLGFKINLGRKAQIDINTVDEVLKDQSEIERRWDEALFHSRGCRCDFCWARRTVKNPPAGIDYEFLDIEGIRYSVVGDQIDLTKHHGSCGCVDCMKARGTKIFKHTPHPCVIVPVLEDDIAARWDSANLL